MNDELTIPVSEKDHALGPADAPVTLVEYGDFECPDCFNAVPLVKALREHFGDKLRFIFRHFPQNSVHPHASTAAAAAEAADSQGRFWDMHDSLFRHQKELATLDLTHLALRLGLEVYRFQRDGESAHLVKRVREDYAGGVASGVHGTPTFFINSRRYAGPAEVPAMIAEIESVLAERGA